MLVAKKKNSWVLGALLAMASLMGGQVQANSIANDAIADAVAATSIGGFCFGIGNLFVADVASGGNNETLVLNVARRLTDLNNDGNFILRQVMTVVAYGANNQVVWESPAIVTNSRDILTPIPGQIVGYNPAAFLNLANFGRFFNFFPFGAECVGMSLAIHNGKTYVVVVGGYSAASGNSPLTGQDDSSGTVTVLDGDTGAVVRTFRFTRQNKRYISTAFALLIDYNDDGNIDVVEWRVRPFTENRVTLTARVYDLVSGAELAFFSFPIASSTKLN